MKLIVDILYRIVFNICEKILFPALMHDTNSSCRNYTACTQENCFNLKQNKVRNIVFREAVSFCKQLVEFSSLSVDSYFIIAVFNKYK